MSSDQTIIAAPEGKVVEIPISRGHTALIDECDAGRVLRCRWNASMPQKRFGTVYAWCSIGGKTVMLHRFILQAPSGLVVDHKNNNGLDCRRINLRITTNALNCRRKRIPVGVSGFRGVARSRNRWCAILYFDNKREWLGIFDTALDAAIAWDTVAFQRFGEFAQLNFPHRQCMAMEGCE